MAKKYATCSVTLEDGLKITLNGKTYEGHLPVKWRHKGTWEYSDGQDSHSSYLRARVFTFETPDGDIAVHRDEIESDFDFLDYICPM